MGTEPTIRERLAKIEYAVFNHIPSELRLHRWAIGLVIALLATLIVLVVKL